ncbi:MAG: glycosyltransferase [Sphingobacteriaceae bacterium]|nr:MAG: glycosyltransferase [Sphingobacteriaceae bacterium]
MKKLVSVVIPSFNEEGNVKTLALKLIAIFQNLPYNYEVIFVDDGSSDHTLYKLKSLSSLNENFFYLEFSRNFGHQNALKAGYDHASGDCVICMDSDMQHPPELIPEFLEKWEEGFDVVYTTRQYADEGTYFKRKTSDLYYRILNSMSDTKLEKGTADFRLIDRKVVNVLTQLPENGLFMRGLIRWLGFKQFAINYVCDPRFSGQSKYTFKRMVNFAIEGLTAFSVRPLNIAIGIGLFFSIAAIAFMPYIFVSYFTGHAVSGWASLMATVVFFGGMQLMVLGIIGMYLGKLFMQAKQRPNYIVRSSNLVKINHDLIKL